MTKPQPLDYRRPGAIDVARIKAIRDHLRRREAMLAGTIFTHLAIGVPLLLVGPFLMACIFWFTMLNFRGYADTWPWSWFFWGLLIVLTPLLFWTEYRTRGSLFSDIVIDSGGSPSTPYIAGPELGLLISVAANPRVAASGFIELFLTGPRFVLAGVGKLRGARRLRGANVDRAAEIVADLRRFDQGVPIPQLAHEGEAISAIVQPLAYLLFHEWVAMSSDGQRVWLLTESKRALNG